MDFSEFCVGFCERGFRWRGFVSGVVVTCQGGLSVGFLSLYFGIYFKIIFPYKYSLLTYPCEVKLPTHN